MYLLGFFLLVFCVNMDQVHVLGFIGGDIFVGGMISVELDDENDEEYVCRMGFYYII